VSARGSLDRRLAPSPTPRAPPMFYLPAHTLRSALLKRLPTHRASLAPWRGGPSACESNRYILERVSAWTTTRPAQQGSQPARGVHLTQDPGTRRPRSHHDNTRFSNMHTTWRCRCLPRPRARGVSDDSDKSLSNTRPWPTVTITSRPHHAASTTSDRHQRSVFRGVELVSTIARSSPHSLSQTR